MSEKILILDGAMGTMIQRHKLGEEDYRGTRFADWHSDLKGNNDLWERKLSTCERKEHVELKIGDGKASVQIGART